MLGFDPQTNYTAVPTVFPGGIYDGTIFEISRAFKKKSKGVRGIAVVGDFLWVADEITNAVYVVNRKTGEIVNQLSVTNPIAIHFDAYSDKIYIG